MKKFIVAAVAAMLFATGSAVADDFQSVTVDISGIGSFGFQGDPGNTILEVDTGVGGEVNITSIDWEVNLEMFDVSWAEEASIGFVEDGGVNQFFPGIQSSDPIGGAGSFVTPLNDADGIVNIEFFEVGFDDVVGGLDAQYLDGSTLTINFKPKGGAVPEPSSIALITLVGMGIAARRRR